MISWRHEGSERRNGEVLELHSYDVFPNELCRNVGQMKEEDLFFKIYEKEIGISLFFKIAIKMNIFINVTYFWNVFNQWSPVVIFSIFCAKGRPFSDLTADANIVPLRHTLAKRRRIKRHNPISEAPSLYENLQWRRSIRRHCCMLQTMRFSSNTSINLSIIYLFYHY